MTNADHRFSRITASAAGLAESDFEPQRFVSEPVLLTGSAAVLATPNGRDMARDALLLLMRTTKNLVVALPAELSRLEAELQGWAQSHAWDDVPAFTTLPVDLTKFTAILSIGGPPRPNLPWTAITSDGWSARATSTGKPINQSCGNANPVGALAAASLGVGEVFKRLLKLRDDRGAFLDGCVFSLWTYAADSDAGPALPPDLEVDLLVAGAGAIGNGVVHLLSQLPLAGRCLVLDRQTYGEENWGTCLRLTRAASRDAKAKHLAGLLGTRLSVDYIEGDIDMLQQRAVPPPVVLSGFDNVEARHAVQDLWPDLIIDGAIGAKLECKVGAHPWLGPTACLRCMYVLPVGQRAEVVQSQMTGLAVESLTNQTRQLTQADVAAADPTRREWLSKYLGKPICSVVDDARALSSGEVAEGFRPSVPFVATFSACMMVTELVRYLTTGNVGVVPQYFLSLLWGPAGGDHYEEDRHADCVCVKRADIIDRFRARRTAA